MKTLFHGDDKIKDRKIKVPMDFIDPDLEYDSSNFMDIGNPKMKTKVIKRKSTGVKKKSNDKTSLF